MKSFCIDREDFKDTVLCNAWVATAIIGAGALGAGASIYGANTAAKAQQDAAATAGNIQMQMYNTTRSDLSSYRDIGKAAADALTQNNYYTTPITMDQATLEKTPGYQFNLTQGTKAVQNAAAARGLGVSGAALKGATTFATGLADNTYQNQFNNANTNQTNAYNRLKSLVDTGENAAAQTGSAGTAAATGASSAAIGSGNAQAAAANQSAGAISSFANNVSGYAQYKGLYGGGSNNNEFQVTGFDNAGNANYGRV